MKGPMRNMAPAKADRKAYAKTIKGVLKTMKGYWWPIILSSVLLIIGVIVSILAPQFLKVLTDEIANHAGTHDIDLDKVAYYGIILAVMYAASFALTYISNALITWVSQKYSERLRTAISEKINKMPLKYFDDHQYGDTLSIVTNDVDQIGQSLQQSAASLVSSICMLIGVLIAMFVTSWQMALTVIASLPLMLLLLLMVTKLAMPLFKKRQDYIGKVNGIVEENFSGAMVIKAFNAQPKKGEAFEKDNQILRTTMFKAQFFGGLMMPIMNFISYFAYAAVCIIGGLLMNNGGLVSFGTISAFLVYVNLFQSPLTTIAQMMNNLQLGVASGERVFNLLEEPELPDESAKPYFFKDKQGAENIKGEIEFRHVKFSYDPSRVIIPDFSAHIKPGMKVAIVGPTGAGKTTMVNLLMRFYETDEGEILIDGFPTKKMKRSEVREIFGMVLQDTWIFDGTIRDNILYGKENVGDDKLNEVLKEANLAHYVSTLPNGLDFQIGEDTALSGGERQLLTIARAMAEDAPLMILDEATSNVDTRTEEQIQEAMDKITKGRTSFVIAHRLSTIRNADLILVMKDGNIIEQGNHEELLKKNGFYASLYNSQFAFE